MDVRAHNRSAWNRLVREENRWTVPFSPAEIEEARNGELKLLLTPTKHVPMSWYPALEDLPVLCLASGGGQQAPMLAAAGARVTVLDNSPNQLEQDQKVAEREGLQLRTIEGDMRDLSCFDDGEFGMIFHPCSNVFVPEINPVWQECFRVARTGGVLLSGMTNPVRYLFEEERVEEGVLEACCPIPYSDLDHLDRPHVRRLVDEGQPLEFGHTLGDQIGGQLRAGFVLAGFYEDRYDDITLDPLSEFIDSFFATRALKLAPVG